ncbi:uncharacterized protein [Solanum tuberosum]|uniref:uncharacterized protein n=1 Tax=Solanum tuberosum TaxID=4113 RepID=UPI00073A3503|nr:PREDICTED: uncharacterized protein LOC107062978 [Solanum tuberosum]
MVNFNVAATPTNINEKLYRDDGSEIANATYFRNLVGSLNYLSNTRQHISFCVDIISRFLHNPGKLHLGAAKKQLGYLAAYQEVSLRRLVADFNQKPTGARSSTSLEGSSTFMMNNSELRSLDKPRLINLALDASDELHRLARSGEPLWYRSVDGDGEMLNVKEYDSSFILIIGMKPGHFTTEAT